ncbi:hypothetical protein SmphiM12_354 [Sinorhizobium phage phiM12]|uniref:Uncharacterized protein n=1 Tax=Sinorhizobium phage phiM12 TaxID=1357423 RepID=S5M7F6_9CAUD|nr:hypothetical protein AB690_gp241 [Sinorhizobium phage phiM12]AGR47986.1 hypothetical protein SmphiM12_354 [Sinorhizobium phage phiM12]
MRQIIEHLHNRLAVQLVEVVNVSVVLGNRNRDFLVFIRNRQTFRHSFDDSFAALFMPIVVRQFRRIGRCLAKIVAESRETGNRRMISCRHLVQNHHRVNEAIAFRVILVGLWNPEQSRHFRKHVVQRADHLKEDEEATRHFFRQRLFRFLPNAIRLKGLQFAGRRHFLKQLERLRSDIEILPPRKETGNAQHAKRVFLEGFRIDVAKHLVFQIVHAAERIDDLTIHKHCHGVDGKIAAHQVLFDGDRRVKGAFESLVAFADLAFDPGECVFAVLCVKEYREIRANLLHAHIDHIGRSRTDPHVIFVLRHHAHLQVADRATYKVFYHSINPSTI